MITILGPTASGKTKFAALLAFHIDGEIISADSRQVYKGMDTGTGKDYDDYLVMDKKINYHLIDLVEPGYEYNVYEYQNDFLDAYNKIIKNKKRPILCGGTGLYIEAVLKSYKLIKVPVNKSLRKSLVEKNTDELVKVLKSYKKVHNISDTNDKERLVRAIEIQQYYKEHKEIVMNFPEIPNITFGILLDRKIIRERITNRLNSRLNNGMVEEVEVLLKNGLKPEQLIFYGLEYKFITQYIIGEITYEEMFSKLNTAIHQFAKRQMTWFRKMQREGSVIHWLDGEKEMEENKDIVIKTLKSKRLKV